MLQLNCYVKQEDKMDNLNIATNIVNLRKQKEVTQEELASFIGVTKASVSKWENGQSMPDIMLLPMLASYFEVTIDELIGYKPMLSREQIRLLYKTFAESFSKEPFEEVFKRSESYVKKYYSCYSFLYQVCALWGNHYMLAEGEARQTEILEKTLSLCNHIIDNCNNAIICSDAVVMRANLYLMLKEPDKAIEDLADTVNPYRLINQSDGILIQAYVMKGDMEKADKFTQISLYNHFGSIIVDSIQLLNIHMQDKDFCMKTIKRVDKFIEAYSLDGLIQQITVVYHYQTAMNLCLYGITDEAILKLERYSGLIIDTLKNDSGLHGDDYFDKLSECFEELDLGSQLVRDKNVVLDSAIGGLLNPAFEIIKDRPEFERISSLLKEAKDK